MKISQGLLLDHQPLFALRLAQIRLGVDFDPLFEVLMKQGASILGGVSLNKIKLDEDVLGEGKMTKS